MRWLFTDHEKELRSDSEINEVPDKTNRSSVNIRGKGTSSRGRMSLISQTYLVERTRGSQELS
jgi:hypothetical protein